jgi:hypothetical protein
VAWLATLSLDELRRFDQWPKHRQLHALEPHANGYDWVIGDARRAELARPAPPAAPRPAPRRSSGRRNWR